MDYTILLNADKELIATRRIPIFVGEKNVDKFKIIIPIDYEDRVPTLQMILPDGKTGKIKVCEYEPEIYKDRFYVMNVDIVSELTQYPGYINMWLIFFGTTQEKTSKTSQLEVEIIDHKGFSAIEPDTPSEDIVQQITELQIAVNSLRENKGDTVKFDEDTNTLQLMSGETVLSTCEIPDDVTWSEL